MSYKLIAICVLVLIVGVVPLPAQTDRGSVILALFVQDIVDYNQQAIDLSRIALGRATSRAVLNHARDVINYATKSNALFRHYAAKNGLALRETPESSLILNAVDFEMDYMKTATDLITTLDTLSQKLTATSKSASPPSSSPTAVPLAPTADITKRQSRLSTSSRAGFFDPADVSTRNPYSSADCQMRRSHAGGANAK